MIPINVNNPTRIPCNLDDDGFKVTAGDSIMFSFGIPPVRVIANIERINGRLYAMTPNHAPKKCRLKKLRKCVGSFYKI